MENIEKRLSRIEAHLFGKAEQAQEQPRPKTRIEWLQELPDGYRERALANCREWDDGKPSDECDEMAYAIWGMCPWAETTEGRDFWLEVRNHYLTDSPLPPLPDEVKKYEGRFTHADLDKYAKIIEETAKAWREIHKQLTSK